MAMARAPFPRAFPGESRSRWALTHTRVKGGWFRRRLGNNDFDQAAAPGELINVVAIAAGALHFLALRNDGTIIAWGFDSDGQATVPPGLTGVIAIAAGMFHSLALKSDGTVVAWGNNDFAQTTIPAVTQHPGHHCGAFFITSR